MRALVVSVLLGAASVAGAQVPAAPAPSPTQPAASPTPPKSGGGEFRVGGFMISGDRSYEFSGVVRNATGTMQGVDVVLRARGIGLQFKSITGTFESQPHVTSADARILLFPPVFTIMVGAGRRALWSDLNAESPTQFDIAMAGISSTASIGGSGLRTNFMATVYAPVKPPSKGSATASQSATLDKGMEGEASIMWRIPKMPFYVQAGYRTEVFTAKTGARTTPEEVRGVKIGGGLLVGGR